MRQREEAFRFDLVPDDEPVGPEEPGREARPSRGVTWRRLAAQPRRRLVAMGVALAVVVAGGAGAAVAVARDRAADSLVAAPGGVADLSAPLATAWRVPLDGPVVGYLPGVAVEQVGDELVGLSLRDGGEAWRRAVGTDLRCPALPATSERAPVPERLACVTGHGTSAQVTVLDDAGRVLARRSLARYAAGQVDPASDGGLLVVERTGAAAVTLTDAATGHVRWTRILPARPVADTSDCTEKGAGSAGTGAPLGLDVVATATLVQVEGCGLDGGWLLADGTPLWTGPGTGAPIVAATPGGGVLVSRSDGTSLLVDAEGHRVLTSHSAVALPWATDGSADGVPTGGTLVYDKQGGLDMVTASGHELWKATRPGGVSDVLAQAGGLAVVLDDAGSQVTGISLADGTVRWAVPTGRAGVRGALGARALGAATDGRSVVVSLLLAGDGTAGSAQAELVGIDLATGEHWTQHPQGPREELHAVGGRLLDVTTSNGEKPLALSLLAPRTDVRHPD